MKSKTAAGAEVLWICCQLGARQHYSVPRSLHRAGLLEALVTDIWINPDCRASALYPTRLRERFHRDLADALIVAPTLAATISFEVRLLAAGRTEWDSMVRRNDWFQEQALRFVTQIARQSPGRRFRLFSFSYAARRLFQFAKSCGWETILEQIDPGPFEERLVKDLHGQHPGGTRSWRQAPEGYWQSWREECDLADYILVNSLWSRHALLNEGVSETKLRTVPLAYEASIDAVRLRRTYPPAFTTDRPLRVLFLGQVNLRKGTAAILESTLLLKNEPVEFWLVGPEISK